MLTSASVRCCRVNTSHFYSCLRVILSLSVRIHRQKVTVKIVLSMFNLPSHRVDSHMWINLTRSSPLSIEQTHTRQKRYEISMRRYKNGQRYQCKLVTEMHVKMNRKARVQWSCFCGKNNSVKETVSWIVSLLIRSMLMTLNRTWYIVMSHGYKATWDWGQRNTAATVHAVSLNAWKASSCITRLFYLLLSGQDLRFNGLERWKVAR